MAEKKFAYIQNTPIPGPTAHGIFVTKICEAVSIMGYDSILISPANHPARLEGRTTWKYYDIKTKFEVKRINLLNNPFTLLLKYFSRSLYHFFVTMIFAIQSWYYVKHKNITIIETADPEIIFIFALLKSFYRTEIIYDLHIMPPTWLFDPLLKRVSLYVCTTGYLKDQIISHKVAQDKIAVMPMGYDPKLFKQPADKIKLRNKLNLPQDKFIVGYIGRLATLGKEKGVRELLEITGELVNKIPLAIVIVGGPAELIKDYKRYAKKLGITKNIYLVDQVKPKLAARYLQAVDLGWLVYPDTHHYKNQMSPMKAIEYMAAKLPIIASDFPSLHQILTNTEAYFVDPDNHTEIINTISQIYAQPNKAIIKTGLAYEKVRQYTWVNRQKSIFDILK
jgi:glycosyltransferase involved in cell wall biosynthesis